MLSLQPLTAYQLFLKDPLLQEDFAGLPLAQRSKKASAKWKAMDTEAKAKYVKHTFQSHHTH